MSLPREALIRFAQRVDSERAIELESEFGQSAGSGVAVALATAFPQFLPCTHWQRESLARIELEGWRVPRTRAAIREQLAIRLKHSVPERDTLPEQDAGRPRVLTVLRQGAWVERARIALRELLPHTLGGAPLLATAQELSWLAESLLELATAEACESIERRYGAPRTQAGTDSEFIVLAMGKLGGSELNAGSDVDLCFVYDTDDGGSSLSLHEHWTRVAQRLVQNLELPTDDGSAWRVDLRLRPEGSQGAICNSLAASERYYETWGRLWERVALIRARAVGCETRLGQRFLREVVSPFVYQGEVEPAIADALQQQLMRSRLQLRVELNRDLKLGSGGIREAEFFVQALQLIWGGRERSVRAQGIYPALDRLLGAGLLAEREAREMTEAYTLLRTVEHRIQWHSGIQTHSLPSDEAATGLIARTLQLAQPDGLRQQLDRARSIIAEAFSGLCRATPGHSQHVALFALLERSPVPSFSAGTHATQASAIAEALDPQDARLLAQRAAAASEANQQGMSPELIEHYRVLSRRPDGILGSLTRERYPRFTDWLLDAVAQSPDPNQAALGLRQVFGRIDHPWAYFAALAEDEHAVRRLVTALASSPFIADTLASRPDALDAVLSIGGSVEDPGRVIAQELDAADPASLQDDYERLDAVVTALRRTKSRLFVEAVIADLSGAIELRHARQTLSDLADVSLAQAANHVFQGVPRGLGIVALGKLGAQDLGYGSDLDVIFLFDPALAPEPGEAQAFFIRRAQQIIRLISMPHPAGPGYELDVRLRPSGSQGMLVTSLDAFASYHGLLGYAAVGAGPCVVSSGAAWERQTLLRARACAGDMGVAARAVALAEQAAYTRGPPDPRELHRLRLRMQRELAREREGYFDLKTGEGGLLDIEFATQWLQMLHGEDPSVHTTNTELALMGLHGAGYLSEAHFQVFREGYDFLRLLEQRLFIIHGRGTSSFDMASPNWPRLARRMRLQDPRAPAAELLRTRYRDVTQAVRGSYLSVLNVS